jgi:hypothetical protein
MREFDIQIAPEGVTIWENEDIVDSLTPSEFDMLAENVAEARRNKAGRSTVTCPTASIQIGDFIHGLEIVRVRQLKGNRTEIVTKPFGWMMFDGDLIQTFERVIQ